MKEFDVVALKRSFPDFGLEAGAVGTIVELIDGRPWVLVEFPSDDITVEPVELADLRLLSAAELDVRRARNVAAE